MPEVKKTDWGMLGLIGLGVWYFFIRKPGEGAITPLVVITGIDAGASPGEFGATIEPGRSIKLRLSLQNRSTRNGQYVSLPVSVSFSVVGLGISPRGFEVITTLPANATANVDSPSFTTRADAAPGRRDVAVIIRYEGTIIANRTWEGVYYVSQPVVTPAVTPLSLSWI